MHFLTPKPGATPIEDWTIEGGHMAERAARFIIIALGESIVVTGATFSEAAWTATSVAAFLIALLGSIAMWWIYFHIGAEAGSKIYLARQGSRSLGAAGVHVSASAHRRGHYHFSRGR